MSEEIYQLTVPMSRRMLDLGWPAFAAVRCELACWYADPGSAYLEYRYHGDRFGDGLIATFRVRRDYGR